MGRSCKPQIEHAHVEIGVFWRTGDVEGAEARLDRARPVKVREEVLAGSSSDTRTGLRLDPTPRACFGLAEQPEKTAKCTQNLSHDSAGCASAFLPPPFESS